MKKKASEEEFDETDQTLVTWNVGELLVIRRALHVKEVPLEPSERKKIFHTQCSIRAKMCELIIDGGSCTNVASVILIDKLQVPIKMHSAPYTLQWCNKE